MTCISLLMNLVPLMYSMEGVEIIGYSKFPNGVFLSKGDRIIYDYQEQLIGEISKIQRIVERLYYSDKGNVVLGGYLMYLTYAVASMMIPAGVLFNLIVYRRTSPYWIKYLLVDKLELLGSDDKLDSKVEEQLIVIYDLEEKIRALYFSKIK